MRQDVEQMPGRRGQSLRGGGNLVSRSIEVGEQERGESPARAGLE